MMKTIMMFPGQGSQHTGMGAELFEHFPTETALANDILGYDIKALCLDETHTANLNQTAYTQPLLFTVNALSEMKRKADGGPAGTVFIGHSLGEYNALLASGVFSFEVGLRLVKERGRAMEHAGQTAATSCGMLAVLGLTEDVIQKTIQAGKRSETVSIANLNAAEQIILSGETASLKALEAPLKEAGARKCVPLTVSGAFHSPYMESAFRTMQEYLTTFTFDAPHPDVYANLTAQPYSHDEKDIKDTLTKQVTHKVRWRETILNLRKTYPEAEFIEVGPGKVLTGLLRRI